MPLHRLSFEHVVKLLLRLQVQPQPFATGAQDPAQRVRPHRQALGIERRLRGKHAEALPEQLQVRLRAVAFAPRHLVQHDVAVDVGIGDQGHRRNRRRGGGRATGRGWTAQSRQVVGQRVQEPARELGGMHAQLADLRVDIGLDLAAARLLGKAEQLALQLHHGQLQRRRQYLRGDAVDGLEQVADPFGDRRAGKACRRLAGKGCCGA